MRRRIVLAVLAALLVLPAVSPARAGQPEPVAPEVSAAPTDVPVSTDLSALEASPEPEVSAAPEPTDVVVPSADPAPSTDPAPSDSPAATDAPAPAPSAAPDPAPTAEPGDADGDDSTGRPDVRGRYIVVLDSDAAATQVVERLGKQRGIKAERTFDKAIRGFTARLDNAQRAALEADPNVVAVVPDEVIEVAAQTIPTGVSRIGTKSNAIAKIDGVDERVDADVAIVDTGIQPNHPDLNVVGGYNCSTTDRALWRDVQGHGTHVAGTVAALDNGAGVVGVAPGARLYAVKILNDDGYGLLSWYVCGLDWILAQRDPADTSRQLIEAVNMSVVKDGRDDANCGNSNNDVLHKAICRVTGAGITVVAAAGNDSKSSASRVPAAYNEVITVSALADTDGKAGGLGGNRCYSWGSYDKDDTFADFSNYGSDVDIIAPGKCIWSSKPGSTYGYSSGTSMATPAVTGAAALYKASRPKATPSEVREALMYLGNSGWSTSTDPDSYHEKLLDVSKLGPLGTFSVSAGSSSAIPETGGVARLPVTVSRSATFFERVTLTVSSAPAGWTAGSKTSLLGWTAKSATLTVTIPAGTPAGVYEVQVKGTNQGRTVTDTAEVQVGLTPFTDIATSPFNGSISWLYLSGITGGCSATLFCPTAKVTRAQMAAFLARALELPSATTDYFDDDDGITLEHDINRMARAGLTGGCAPRRFCPTATVTRAQMAAFLARALDLPYATTDYFDDDDGTTHERDINRLAKAGLTGGCGPRRYCPSQAITREQMAAFLHRAFKD